MNARILNDMLDEIRGDCNRYLLSVTSTKENHRIDITAMVDMPTSRMALSSVEVEVPDDYNGNYISLYSENIFVTFDGGAERLMADDLSTDDLLAVAEAVQGEVGK